MKTIKGILLAVIMVSTISVFADTGKAVKSSAELQVTIEAQLDGKVIVGFEKLAEEKVNIKIFDAYGSMIHSESVKESKVVLKRFDLSNWPAGKYTYEVSNNVFTLSKVIEKK